MLSPKFVMIFEQFNTLHPEGIHMFLNHKLQATNYKQTTNHKLQITKKEASCGQFLNALGEEHKMMTFIKPDRAVCNFGHCNLGFVCNLYFVICNFFPLLTNSGRFFISNARSKT